MLIYSKPIVSRFEAALCSTFGIFYEYLIEIPASAIPCLHFETFWLRRTRMMQEQCPINS